MRYEDTSHEELYNVELLPACGDQDPKMIRTRCFSLANQTDYAYVFEMNRNDPYRWMITDLMMANRHWSDPIYYPA